MGTSHEAHTALIESLPNLIIANTLQVCCSHLHLKNEKIEFNYPI